MDPGAWLILLKAPKLGPVRIRQLISEYQSPDAVIQASAKQLRELKVPDNAIRWIKQAGQADLQNELAWLSQDGNEMVSFKDPAYPALLAQLHDAPVLLFTHGNVDLLSLPQLAMVGSRHPSADGKQTAFQFAECLAAGGLIITSGLAQGIDAESHKGALSCGRTIAVCATGLDRVYPPANLSLAKNIAREGLLVSEFLPGTNVHKAFFPRRNRLISGLSLGTLVVEASLRSGSLITAQCALEQGREVFAIPGSIHNPMSKGCHGLIKQGAKLVENAADIIEELQSHLQRMSSGLHSSQHREQRQVEQHSTLDPEYRDLLEHITYAPISIDQLVETTKQRVEAISSMLLILELEGLVQNAGAGCYSRC
ncbi:MAG: DNA-protecting protein DprA [Gammaproteobacteria bacterium]|nr:DNA-protecting protein DprA [Gammaproteobacteria bacterium]NNM14548.1 DNA-protecting protein DprA [Gammaproteobacteria bacterium]